MSAIRPSRIMFLAIGPVATVAGLIAASGGFWLQRWQLSSALIIALLVWSPLPIGLPALLTQSARDAALPGVHGLRRAALLLGDLGGAHSAIRTELFVSLASFVVAVSWAVPYMRTHS